MVRHFWKPYIGQAVDGKLDLMVLIGGMEEQTAIQLEMSMWLRKRDDENFFEGHTVRKGDHVNWKRIFSDYTDRRGGVLQLRGLEKRAILYHQYTVFQISHSIVLILTTV
jgi:hypothetical protein